jgi:hypothetical protein
VQATLPNWFQADEVFSNDGHWYFGSQQGLNIGPYDDRDAAQSKSVQVAKALLAIDCDDARLQFVQRVLHEEWDSVGTASFASPDVEVLDLAPPPPEPVRGGEEQKRWYRAARFFQVDNVWFFSTREGLDIGPYDSEMTAKSHERKLVTLLIRAKTSEEAYRVIYEYKHRPEPEYATPKYVSGRR